MFQHQKKKFQTSVIFLRWWNLKDKVKSSVYRLCFSNAVLLLVIYKISGRNKSFKRGLTKEKMDHCMGVKLLYFGSTSIRNKNKRLRDTSYFNTHFFVPLCIRPERIRWDSTLYNANVKWSSAISRENGKTNAQPYAPLLRYICNIFNYSIIYNNFNYKMSRFVDYTVEDAADFITFELESGAESEDLLKNLVR